MVIASIQEFVHWFRSAAPYIHAHHGKTIVVKFAGEAISDSSFSRLIYDLALLNSIGIRLLMVYGARPQIEARMNTNGLTATYKDGLRVTDAATMECVKETVGALAIEIKAKLSMSLDNTPMADACVRVTDGNFLVAQPLGVRAGTDFQYTGKVRRVDVNSINTKLDNNEIVLVPPIGYSPTGEIFNFSADDVATELSIAMNADKLIFMTEADGLMNGHGKPIRQLTRIEAENFLKNTKYNDTDVQQQYDQFKQGVYACSKGIQRVHLIDRQVDGSLLQELFSRDGIGAMISAAPFDVIRTATVDDIAGILELIQPLENEGILVQRSREKLELEIDHFTVILRDGVIIGCTALYPFAEEPAAELSCLVVHPDYQKGGMGSELFNWIEKIARESDLSQLYVLTTHAEHWFLERGFIQTNMEKLPVSRQLFYNYKRSSKILVKNIN